LALFADVAQRVGASAQLLNHIEVNADDGAAAWQSGGGLNQRAVFEQ
jgi:hypothetical protein